MSNDDDIPRQQAVLSRFVTIAERLLAYTDGGQAFPDGSIALWASYNGRKGRGRIMLEPGALAVDGRILQLLESVFRAALHGAPEVVIPTTPPPAGVPIELAKNAARVK
jgi:hypothetical protein